MGVLVSIHPLGSNTHTRITASRMRVKRTHCSSNTILSVSRKLWPSVPFDCDFARKSNKDSLQM